MIEKTIDNSEKEGGIVRLIPLSSGIPYHLIWKTMPVSFEQSGMKSKAHFITASIFGKSIKQYRWIWGLWTTICGLLLYMVSFVL